MERNQPIPCPECNREKYFPGLCFYCNLRKKRVRYQQMTPEEINSTIGKIIADIGTVGNYKEVYNDFIGLLAYQDINTKEIADAAFQQQIFYPPLLYRNASEDIRNQLIERLRQPNCPEANDILRCLSAIGGDKIRALFHQLDTSPLPWSEKLYAPCSKYAQEGGWTFDETAQNIDLIYPQCYALLPENRTDNAVKTGEAKPETCTICNCRIVNMLTIDGNDERLRFLGIHGKIQLPLCPNCATMSDKTIIRYSENGESSFEIIAPYGNENYIGEKDLQALLSNNLKLSETKQPVYFSCGNDDLSTIGGIPEWIQDWEYEDCPDCSKKMKLLAALCWEQIIHGNEGSLYFEICTDCRVVIAFHQQT